MNMLTQNNNYNVKVSINSNSFVDIAATVPENEKLVSLRMNWNNFQECVLVNKLTKVASPSHLISFN
jgi:hypothetical protein